MTAASASRRAAPSARTAELLAAVDALTAAHNVYMATPDPAPKRGKKREFLPPDDSYFDLCDELVEVFFEGDIPHECRGVAEAAAIFREKLEEYHARTDVNNPLPRDGFWSARQALEKARAGHRPEERTPLESIRTLADQKVPHEQIARMWGLVDASGRGKAHLIQRELDNPGSVVDHGYVPPTERERQAEARRQEKERSAAIEGLAASGGKGNAPHCPESWEDLWRQQVSFKQAAAMKGVTFEEALAEYAKFDPKEREAKGQRNSYEAPASPPAVAEAATNVDSDDPEFRDDTDVLPDEDDVDSDVDADLAASASPDSQIIALAASGLSIEAIQKQLPGVSRGKIQYALKRAKGGQVAPQVASATA